MVGKLTYGKRKWEHLDGQMRKLIPAVDSAAKTFIAVVDDDTEAFNEYMDALRLPKSTPEEIAARETAMRAGLITAISVPKGLAEKSNALWSVLSELARVANIGCKSDLQVGAKCLETAVFGAVCNVRVNLCQIDDTDFVARLEEECVKALQTASEGCQEVLYILEHRKEE